MDILTDNNLEEIMEEVKNMGMAKLSEDNMSFLLDAIKKFELDKKFTEQGVEQGIEQGIVQGVVKGRKEELVKTVTKQLTKRFGVLPTEVTKKIFKANLDQLEVIVDEIFDFSTLEDAIKHL
jgi:hypothetical protein